MSTNGEYKPAVKRHDFAEIAVNHDYPDFLEVQLQSFEEFVQAEVAPEEREDTGLQAVFTEHFPIQDSRERYTLEFIHYALEAPKHSIEECIAQGLTYSIPLKAKLDRKSTRLNSSHVAISYAVFCSKNKRMSTSFL